MRRQKSITLGLDATGKPIELTPKLRASTHMHVLGGSGKGKSKFLEWMIRQDILAGHGLCLIDWHGELYNNIVRWCASERIGLFNDPRKLILLDVANPNFITAFNPFTATDADISARVSQLLTLVLKAWGVMNSDQMPTFETTGKALLWFMLQMNETLPNAAKLLEFDQHELRAYANEELAETLAASSWRELRAREKKIQDWDPMTISTKLRLSRLLTSQAIRRFMGLNNIPNIDIPRVMDESSIVLVNLAESDHLPRDIAKVFAAFFLNEFFREGRKRAQEESRVGTKPNQFLLYLDEFQEYINDDMSNMLDQVRKGGLHIVMAHQTMAHFLDYPKLKESVLTNARIRALFAGLSVKTAIELGEEMCLAELNTPQIKKALYHTIHVYQEETRTIYSETEAESSMEATTEMSGSGSSSAVASSSGSGSSSMQAFTMPSDGVGLLGWFDPDPANVMQTDSAGLSEFVSDSASEVSSEFSASGSSSGSSRSTGRGKSVVPVWVPIPKQELMSETEWTVEEKRLKIAQMLKYQAERHCYINFDEPGGTQPLCVPFVDAPAVSALRFGQYEELVCKKQEALPAAEVDRLLGESEAQFIDRARLRHARKVTPLKSRQTKRQIEEEDDEFDDKR